MDSSYSSGLFGLERIHAAIRRRLAPAQINSTARHTAADSGNVGVGVGGGGQSRRKFLLDRRDEFAHGVMLILHSHGGPGEPLGASN